MNLRDAGKLSGNSVSDAARSLAVKLRDTKLPLTERLAILTDIIEMEVGDTGLLRSRSLERDYGCRKILLKLEGNNPTGTQKDRIGFAQTMDALEKGYATVALATCGNYGASVALATNLAGLACKVFIPEKYHTERIAEMEQLGAEIIRLGTTYEATVSGSSAAALEHGWYDANPGAANTELQLLAYSQIAFEIFAQLGEAPAYCAVPVSNGTLLAGIYQGFVALLEQGKTSRLPRMIAGSSVFKNPIVHSFRNGLKECQDLNPALIRETKINEPLINWHSFDGQEALDALHQSDGRAANISDRAMKEMATYLLKREAIRILPASTAGLIGLLECHESSPLEADHYVAILTAKN